MNITNGLLSVGMLFASIIILFIILWGVDEYPKTTWTTVGLLFIAGAFMAGATA